MQDKLLTCQSCQNPFVYSAYEQIQNSKKGRGLIYQTHEQNPNQPKYCPICTAIKQSELKHPPKPQKKSLD